MTASAHATITREATAVPSTAERHRRTHRLCAACGTRPARFQYRGVVKADRDHTLCFQCYRSTVDSVRNVERPTGKLAWFPTASLPPALERVLRADKYEELARRRRRAQIAARHALGLQ